MLQAATEQIEESKLGAAMHGGKATYRLRVRGKASSTHETLIAGNRWGLDGQK